MKTITAANAAALQIAAEMSRDLASRDIPAPAERRRARRRFEAYVLREAADRQLACENPASPEPEEFEQSIGEEISWHDCPLAPLLRRAPTVPLRRIAAQILAGPDQTAVEALRAFARGAPAADEAVAAARRFANGYLPESGR